MYTRFRLDIAVDLSCGVTRLAPGQPGEAAGAFGIELPHYKAAVAQTDIPDNDKAKVSIWP